MRFVRAECLTAKAEARTVELQEMLRDLEQ